MAAKVDSMTCYQQRVVDAIMNAKIEVEKPAQFSPTPFFFLITRRNLICRTGRNPCFNIMWKHIAQR
jgi:hypothetical protein